MVAKIIAGNHFQQAVDYVQDIHKGDKNARMLMHSKGIFLGDNKSVASLLDSYASYRGNRPSEPLLHISISFHPKDAHRITDRFACLVISDYMKEMGYSNSEFVVYQHSDKAHQHFHLLLCAVDKDGKKINRSNELLRNKNVCKRLTLKYGLYMSSGKENVNRDRLRGKDAAKYSMFDGISSAKEKSEDWKEFNDMLMEKGLTMKFHYNNTNGKVMGITFSNGQYSFSGSKIDRSLSLSCLKEKFGDFREIVHESMHICYDNYQYRLSQLNSGNIHGGKFFTMLRYFPYWENIFPNGLPKSFSTPYPSVQSLLSRKENWSLEKDVTHSRDGKTSFVGLATLFLLLMEPYQPQIAISTGGGSTGGGLPWRDLDDDERWKFRFAVAPSIYPKYIKPRYIKSKPITPTKKKR